VRDQARIEIGRLTRPFRIACIKIAEHARGCMRFPFRRFQARDAPTFLIDHDHGVGRQDAAERGYQPRELWRVLDVAREQDDAGGRMRAKQRGLFRVEGSTGNPDDGGGTPRPGSWRGRDAKRRG